MSEPFRWPIGRERRAHERRRRRSALFNRLRFFINDQDTVHEIVVIVLSYCFIAASAWDDGLLGFAPSHVAFVCEVVAAAALLLEIISRIIFANRRTASFWVLLLLDSLSILTVFPGFFAISFLRLFRLAYASIRLIVLLDKLACRFHAPVYLIGIYPLVVPVLAALVFAFERGTKDSPIHNYFEALSVCLTFSLTLGNVRPSSLPAMIICGALFLAGIVCIGVCTNAISNRYQQTD